jgi:zinicin-like metallopeptidase
VDVVVAEAIGDRLPGAEALRETLRRRRATGGPAEQTFATLVGLELRPRRMRAASSLWKLVGDRHGIDKRDGLWSHPDLMPTAEDLDEPLDFADRLGDPATLPDDLDPIAELERTERREQEARDRANPSASSASSASSDAPSKDAPSSGDAGSDSGTSGKDQPSDSASGAGSDSASDSGKDDGTNPSN